MQASAFLKANKAGDSSTCHMQALDLFKRNREREEARDTWSSGGLA